MVTERVKPKKRQRMLRGVTAEVMTGCGPLRVTLNSDSDGAFEVFIKHGKNGQCVRAWTDGLGRMISLVLRIGGSKEDVVRQLRQIECPNKHTEQDGVVTLSCLDAIARAIEAME